jgi:hypothetical protein
MNRCENCSTPVSHNSAGFIKFVLTGRYACSNCGKKLVVSLPSMVVLSLVSVLSSIFISILFDIHLAFPLVLFALVTGVIGFLYCPLRVDER